MLKKVLLSCFFLLNITTVCADTRLVTQDFVKNLAHYRTFSANFSQKTMSPNGRVVASGRGKFWLQRPDFFRWRSTTPSNQIIVGDGRYIWIYDVDLMQVTKQQFNHDMQSPIQLLLANAKTLSTYYRVVKIKSQKNQTEYELSSLSSQANFRHMIFRFRGAVLIGMRLDNSLGQRSNFVFSQIKLNPSFSKNLFRFIPPKGVDVINNMDGN